MRDKTTLHSLLFASTRSIFKLNILLSNSVTEKKEKVKQDESKTELQQCVKALQKQVSMQEAEQQQQQQTINNLQREKMQLQSETAKAKTAGRNKENKAPLENLNSISQRQFGYVLSLV